MDSAKIDHILNSITKKDIPPRIYMRLINLHASDYFFFGISLGVPTTVIEDIRYEYPRDCRMVLAEIIFSQFVKMDKYTPRDLYFALRRNQHNMTACWLINELEKCLPTNVKE